MKKWMGIFAAGLMAAVVVTGCGSTGTASAALSTTNAEVSSGVSAEAGTDATAAGTETSNSTAAAATAEAAGATEAGDTDGATGKVLVLYYSASGNTKNIADMIAEDTGADEFEITPSQPYTSDDLNYGDQNSRVVKEHDDPSLQNVAFDSYDIPDWDSYDTVFVGYPIWWQDASWVMKSYVQHVDFTGKTVIPFCTSSASGIGDSGKNLAELAGTGDWQDGQRFSGGASAEDVENWVNSLGF